MTPEERENRALISSDQCIIDDKEYYVRGLIEIPIIGADEPFLWGVWACMWEQDFDVIHETWTLEGRERTIGPFKGRLANKLGVYPQSTSNLRLRIEIQPIGSRPHFFLEEDHLITIMQRDGITESTARELSSSVLHDLLFEG